MTSVVGAANVGGADGKTGLERIQSWVSWGVGTSGGPSAGRRVAGNDAEIDWEALLRHQNSANDELCSDNGRLRAEVERLRVEERGAAAVVAVATSAASGLLAGSAEGGADRGAEEPDQGEEGFVTAALGAARETLESWQKVPRNDESIPVSLGTSEGWKHLYYCGRFLGKEAIPRSDGQCGSADGPQCDACKRFQAREEEHDEETEEDATTTASTDEGSADGGGTKGRHAEALAAADAWRSEVTNVLAAAMHKGFKEDGMTSEALFGEEPEEQDEMAALINEKIHFREMVEQQQDRIEALESELHSAGAALPGAGLVGGAALSLAAAARGLGGLSDVQTAGRGIITAMWKPKADSTKIEVGYEYEVIGEKGAVVRNGASLRSDKIAELPRGTLVRVTATSEAYQRRVEIVAVSVARPPSKPDAAKAETADAAADSAAPDAAAPEVAIDGDGAAAASDAPLAGGGSDDGTPRGAGADDGYAADSDGGEDGPPRAKAVEPGRPSKGSADAGEAVVPEPEPPVLPSAPIYGWISVCLKDGTMLIQQAARDAGAEEHAQTTSDEESKDVTLSAVEWEACHQEYEASLRKVDGLSKRLNQMGSEMLMAFEMRTVLSELQMGVRRAREREGQMAEVSSMLHQELTSRSRASWRGRRARPCREADPLHEELTNANETFGGSSASNASAPAAAPAAAPSAEPGRCSPQQEAGEAAAGVKERQRAEVNALDWERLSRELDTTGAALQVSRRRLACLEQEAQELAAERSQAEESGLEELSALRCRLRKAMGVGAASGGRGTTLRRLAAPAIAAVSVYMTPSKASSSAGGASAAPPGAGLGGGEDGSPRRSQKLSSGSLEGPLVLTPSAGLAGSPFSATSSFGGGGYVGDGLELWRRKFQELRHLTRHLREELHRASSSEAALRRSVEARSAALRELLRREATSELVVPQCGLLRIAWNPDAERHALRIAVEEQLRWNLRLRAAAAEAQVAESPAALAAAAANSTAPPPPLPPPLPWPSEGDSAVEAGPARLDF
mmetsp:Transcript_154080/g.492718  ORF Transcript_154080/g.492718 Transcript_154080/m.492718 type:complete len:1024 (+) Transcript_154080:85-3156(+)